MSQNSTQKEQEPQIMCACGTKSEPKTFHIWDVDLRGAECPNCGRAYLNEEDFAHLMEVRKTYDAGKQVVC